VTKAAGEKYSQYKFIVSKANVVNNFTHLLLRKKIVCEIVAPLPFHRNTFRYFFKKNLLRRNKHSIFMPDSGRVQKSPELLQTGKPKTDQSRHKTLKTSIMSEQKEVQSKVTMILICFFLGSLGIHRLMMGYSNWWLMLITLGGCGIWTLVDFIQIILGNMKMADGRDLTN